VGDNIKSHLRYLTWVAVSLVIIDTITTFYGISLGFEETNIIARKFLIFGSFGIIIATITKIVLLAIPYMVYQQIINFTELTETKIKVCEMCYIAVIMTGSLSALNAVINNLNILFS
jgi:hypothetical protein